MIKILFVEDDLPLALGIEYTLKQEGFDVIHAKNLNEAREQYKNNEFNIILLDVMLPDGSGYEFCKEVRVNSEIPIIFMTACDEEGNVVMGLDMGGDDYITKPFNPLELIARVKSNLRRYMNFGNFNNETREDVLRSGGVELNTSTKEVKVDGNQVKVTPIEYRILELLLRNKGRVFSIDEIYEKVWKEESFNVENTVAVHIRRIREKIEINPKEPRYLKVVWGIGYKIEKI